MYKIVIDKTENLHWGQDTSIIQKNEISEPALAAKFGSRY